MKDETSQEEQQRENHHHHNKGRTLTVGEEDRKRKGKGGVERKKKCSSYLSPSDPLVQLCNSNASSKPRSPLSQTLVSQEWDRIRPAEDLPLTEVISHTGSFLLGPRTLQTSTFQGFRPREKPIHLNPIPDFPGTSLSLENNSL